MALRAQDVRVVMVGASLLEGFRSVVPAMWTERFEPRGVLNLGTPGETAGQLWWRLGNGLLRGLSPRAVVIQVGANDVTLAPPDLARVIQDVVGAVRTALPRAHVILHGLLPTTGRFAEHSTRHQQANVLLAAAGVPDGTFLDAWPALADAAGHLRAEFTSDGLHLSPAGYEAWAAVLLPVLDAVTGPAK